MSFYPKVTAGIQGGPVTSDVYTAIQELSTIAWQESPLSTKSVNLQTEHNAKKTH